jgi:hypothetical protein
VSEKIEKQKKYSGATEDEVVGLLLDRENRARQERERQQLLTIKKEGRGFVGAKDRVREQSRAVPKTAGRIAPSSGGVKSRQKLKLNEPSMRKIRIGEDYMYAVVDIPFEKNEAVILDSEMSREFNENFVRIVNENYSRKYHTSIIEIEDDSIKYVDPFFAEFSKQLSSERSEFERTQNEARAALRESIGKPLSSTEESAG